ncbi:hypothetical protein ACFUC1_04950 [Pedococcus sp. NPDC057267]|uniref:hypothetical protein n=1 Tax=Pedococcus sp. NPDC057267 TaxID=3346077 RepID=UPI003641A95E
MAGPSFSDPTTRWRTAALVLGCLLALVGPYVILTRATPSDGRAAAGQAALTTPPGVAGLATSSAPTSPPRGATPTATATSGTGEVVGADVSPDSPLGQAMASCRLAALRVAASMGAADVSLQQFDKHIDAMNLLVAGKISLAVATQFWDQTRVGAAQNAAEFRRTQESTGDTRSQCPGLDPAVAASLPFGPVDQLNQCVTYVGRAATALTKADAAVTTWQHHIHDMEMLRMGEITPAQATAMWQRNWHVGEGQLTAFEAAQAQARAVHCPLD